MSAAAAAGTGGATTIAPLGPARTPELMAVARWRHEAFLAPDYSLEDSVRQLEKVGRDPAEVALLARIDGKPVGVCLLVRDELEPRHDLSPWLASLYVVPDHRKSGIATRLVGAVEDHARGLGARRLYLYTGGAEWFYRRCGWSVLERFDWDGEPFVLMERVL